MVYNANRELIKSFAIIGNNICVCGIVTNNLTNPIIMQVTGKSTHKMNQEMIFVHTIAHIGIILTTYRARRQT